MKIFFKSSITAFTLVLLIWACQRVPLTGRKQFVGLVSNEQMIQLSFTEYKGFMDTSKVVSYNNKDAEMIARVGGRIKTAVENYLIQNNYSQVIDGYQWEFKLVQNKELNAWCMPGGKIVFYTGILSVCKDDAGIAAVMGHEVAHALANHGQQRMSAGLLQQLGAVGTQVAVGNKDPQTQALIMQAYGVGSQVGGMLPFSRAHESEADKIGLTLMAIAGYDPINAVKVWERMSALSNGQAPPEILSTHPSNQTRINELTALIPQAKAEAAKFGVTFK